MFQANRKTSYGGDRERHVPISPILRLLLLLFLTASANASPSAQLTFGWDPVHDDRVDYYELAWGTSKGDYQSFLRSEMATATATDLAQGQAYYFAVRACAAEEAICSAFSEEIMAAAPVGLYAELRFGWDPVLDDRVGYYELGWGTSKGDYRSFLTSQTTTATATGLAQGQAYYFAVRACAADGALCSAFSEEIMAAAPVDAPRAAFSISDAVGLAPHTATYVNGSTGIIDVYYWDFGDGATSSAESPQHTYESPGSYTVRLTVEGPGGTSTAVKGDAVGVQQDGLNFPVIGGDPGVDDDLAIDTSSGLPDVEFGEVVVTTKRQRIYFEEPFADPVLVVTRVDRRILGPYDTTILVDSVDSAGFDIRLRQSSHPKRLHRPETVRYLAIERGLHHLPGGAWIEADHVDVHRGAHSTDVRFGASFANTPVVLTTLVEDIEIGAMAMRSEEVSAFGFDVILDARKGRRSRPAYQTLNYIAWEPSVVDADEMSIIAAYTCDAVAGDASRIELETTFSESPLLMTTTPRKRGKSRLAAELCLDLTEPRDQTAVDMQEVLVGQVAIGEPLRVDGEALCLKVGWFGDREGERTSDGKEKAGRFSSSP